MDERDLALRNTTYARFVETGRAPTADEMARLSGMPVDDVLAGWRRLHEQHALVLQPATAQLRMLNPFSAIPSAYRVKASGRWWYANCAWDAFGICAALRTNGRLELPCPDCGEAIAIEVEGGKPDRADLPVHFLVPATRWWTDVVFT